jgi:hypothetical protein
MQQDIVTSAETLVAGDRAAAEALQAHSSSLQAVRYADGRPVSGLVASRQPQKT